MVVTVITVMMMTMAADEVCVTMLFIAISRYCTRCARSCAVCRQSQRAHAAASAAAVQRVTTAAPPRDGYSHFSHGARSAPGPYSVKLLPIFFSFLPRDAMPACGVRPSVCLSVTFVSCVKTNKDIFEIFSPSGSQAIQVFQCQMGWRYSDGNPAP